MMDLSALRTALAADLADALNLRVEVALPERLNPPLVYLREAEPFVQPAPDGTYGDWTVQFAADIIERPAADNRAMVRAADGHASNVVALIDRYGVTVGAYAAANVAGQEYLTIPVTIDITTR